MACLRVHQIPCFSKYQKHNLNSKCYQRNFRMEIILMIKVKESDYDLTLKKLYEEHKLLVSSLFEIFGDEIKSASLFCLENGISIRERDKIILLLIKFSVNHSIYELDFWKDTLITGIPILSELNDKEFQKMLILFSDYYLAYRVGGGD